MRCATQNRNTKLDYQIRTRGDLQNPMSSDALYVNCGPKSCSLGVKRWEEKIVRVSFCSRWTPAVSPVYDRIIPKIFRILTIRRLAVISMFQQGLTNVAQLRSGHLLDMGRTSTRSLKIDQHKHNDCVLPLDIDYSLPTFITLNLKTTGYGPAADIANLQSRDGPHEDLRIPENMAALHWLQTVLSTTDPTCSQRSPNGRPSGTGRPRLSCFRPHRYESWGPAHHGSNAT